MCDHASKRALVELVPGLSRTDSSCKSGNLVPKLVGIVPVRFASARAHCTLGAPDECFGQGPMCSLHCQMRQTDACRTMRMPRPCTTLDACGLQCTCDAFASGIWYSTIALDMHKDFDSYMLHVTTVMLHTEHHMLHRCSEFCTIAPLHSIKQQYGDFQAAVCRHACLSERPEPLTDCLLSNTVRRNRRQSHSRPHPAIGSNSHLHVRSCS